MVIFLSIRSACVFSVGFFRIWSSPLLEQYCTGSNVCTSALLWVRLAPFFCGSHIVQEYEIRGWKGMKEFDLSPHMGKGGWKGGDAPPLRVKNKSPPLWQKNGYPYQKIHGLFYSIPPFLGLFYCACLFFQSNWVVETANDWKNNFYLATSNYFFCKKFLPLPLPPLFTQAMAA